MDDLILINRPLPEVFAFVTNHSNDKYWKRFVAESRKITASPIGMGTCWV
ncbi:MAG TPA: hypothetical protein VN653_12430 [Anaerolineales bacterium]|nr:hypothetical protein [Anaerolineales bacterium]